MLPQLVRKAPRLTVDEIICAVVDLAPPPITVVLSGGNPALHKLDDVVAGLQARGYRISIETQGTLWKPWIAKVDQIVVSPKPPSSGMVFSWNVLDAFLEGCPVVATAIKVVVGDDADYEFARMLRERLWRYQFFVSVLNPAGSDGDAFDYDVILDGYQALCERVAADPMMHDAKVLPQLHTLAWGARMGV